MTMVSRLGCIQDTTIRVDDAQRRQTHKVASNGDATDQTCKTSQPCNSSSDHSSTDGEALHAASTHSKDEGEDGLNAPQPPVAADPADPASIASSATNDCSHDTCQADHHSSSESEHLNALFKSQSTTDLMASTPAIEVLLQPASGVDAFSSFGLPTPVPLRNHPNNLFLRGKRWFLDGRHKDYVMPWPRYCLAVLTLFCYCSWLYTLMG